jgi:hypothetical protein
MILSLGFIAILAFVIVSFYCYGIELTGIGDMVLPLCWDI